MQATIKKSSMNEPSFRCSLMHLVCQSWSMRFYWGFEAFVAVAAAGSANLSEGFLPFRHVELSL